MKVSALKPVAITLSRELFITLGLLFGVSLVVFVILYSAPGDPFSSLLAGQAPTEQAREEIRQALGIANSWYGQYFAWLSKLLQGDLGNSIRTGQPVLHDIVVTTSNTLFLTLGSMVVTLLVAVPIATYTALRGTTPKSLPMTMFAYVISALPVFWLGYMVIYFFTHQFGWFPLSVGASAENSSLVYSILPILVLGIGSGIISEVVRFLREEITRVMDEEYIRTARAKGASVWKHAFKEAYLLPITEIVAGKIPFLLGGAIIVEQVFNWPGMGRLAWQAAQDRDFPVIMGIAIAAAVLVRMGSLLQTTIYVSVNPRASHG